MRASAALAVLCGACPREVEVLRAALALEAERRRTARSAKAGLPPGALDILLGLYLFLVGLGLGALAFVLRDHPGVMAAAVLSALSVLIVALAVSGLHFVMLADEAFLVLASWPVRSASYLLARVLGAIRRAVGATLILCAPTWLVATVLVGTPVLSGAVFMALALVSTVAIVVLVTALYAALLRWLGAHRMRTVALLANVATVVGPLALAAVLGRQWSWLLADLAEPPLWLPTGWGAAVVSLSAGQIDGQIDGQIHGQWLRAGMALLSVTAIPIAALRLSARMYTRGLATARASRGRSALGRALEWPLVCALGWVRNPADRVVARLFIAHVRGDWRFRAQAVMVPCVTLAVLAAEAAGLSAGALFADPFGDKSTFHPAMLMVAIALIPPIMAVPIVARSSDSGASWLLYGAAIAPGQLAASGRRMIRWVFIAPFIAVIAAGYLAFGDAPLAAVAHVALMTLLADIALVAMHGRLPVVPFSRPADDGELEQLTIVAFLLAYILSALLAAFVVHVLYRWWIAYCLGMVWMIAIRVALGRRARAAPPDV